MPTPPDSAGLASLFHHLDLSISRYHVDTRGPYSGDAVVLDDSDGILSSNWSGFALAIVTVPPAWGRKIGFNGVALGVDWSEDQYAPPWGYVSFVAENTFGNHFLYERHSLSHPQESFYYDETVPSALLLHIEPGWEIDFFSIRA